MSTSRAHEASSPRNVRMTDDEWADIGTQASKRGMTRSDYIRAVLLGGSADSVYVRPNGGGVVAAEVVGVSDDRRILDDGGPLMREGVDAEVVEDEREGP